MGDIKYKVLSADTFNAVQILIENLFEYDFKKIIGY